MSEPKKKWQVSYNVDLHITYEVEAPDQETALKDARDHGFIVNEAWESCDLDHVEQVAE